MLHGGEETVRDDAGYQGVGRREENEGRDVDWATAMKPRKRRRLDESGPEEAAEKLKAKHIRRDNGHSNPNTVGQRPLAGRKAGGG